MFKGIFIALFMMSAVVPHAVADTVIAKDDAGVFYYSSKKTTKQAQNEVLSFCKKSTKGGNCKIILKSSPKSSGHGALAVSATRAHAVWGFSAQDEANQTALQGCVKETATDDLCKVVLAFYDESHIKTVRSTSNSRNVITCHNECQNGSCVRTFPGGRKERWQAPRVFDSISQNWGWDTTTNACGH